MFSACPNCHSPPKTAHAPLRNGISGEWQGTFPAQLAPSWPCSISFKIHACQVTFMSWIAVSDHLSPAVLTFIFQVEDFVYSFPDHATELSRAFSLFFFLSTSLSHSWISLLGFLPLSSWSLMRAFSSNRSNWSISLWESLINRSNAILFICINTYMHKYIHT